MPIERLSFAEMRDLILARKGVEEPTLSTHATGDAYLDANAMAHLGVILQEDAITLANDMNPLTAAGTALDLLAEPHLTVPRKNATKWVGTARFVATSGTPVIPIYTQFEHSDGTLYQTTAAITAGAWSAGEAITFAEGLVDADGVYPGTTANKTTLTSCTVSSPPTGVSPTCTILTTTTAATDDETDTQLRARLLTAMRYRPGGGNPADYVAWAMEVEGCTGAFAYGRWDDVPASHIWGTVTVIPWTEDGPGDASRVADVQAYLDSVAPAGHDVTVEVAAKHVMNLVVYVRPMLGYEMDWTGTFTVTSCSPTYTRLSLSASPIGTIEVGDRIVGQFIGSPISPWEQRIVTAVTASYVDVSAPFTGEIVGDIFPGGPLWQPVVDAVLGVYGLIGPSSSSDPTVPRFPLASQEANSTLCISDLYAAIDSVGGVSSSRIHEIHGGGSIVDQSNAVAPAAAITYIAVESVIGSAIEVYEE
jgi:uncharacterized phage protein gp47/JayE